MTGGPHHSVPTKDSRSRTKTETVRVENDLVTLRNVFRRTVVLTRLISIKLSSRRINVRLDL